MKKGSAAASGVPNTQLLPLLEEASSAEDGGAATDVFGDIAALAGLCARLKEVSWHPSQD